MKNLVHAANATAWVLGHQQGNGFYVRKVVWGLLMAQAEKREGEEIRAAIISVESKGKRKTKGMRRIWHHPQSVPVETSQ
jgi:hypothetical protein